MIVFEHVSKLYEGTNTLALNDISFHIQSGEFVALKGMSGSGKTTILSMILKDVNPTAGNIYINGKDISEIKNKDIPKYRSSIGMVFQDFKLVDDLNAFENIHLAYMLAGGRRQDAQRRITSVMSMLGIDHLHKRLPSQLSGGEAQKICIARAIVNQPSLLIADEPTGNLDPDSTKEIFSLLKLINSQKIAVFMASHDHEAINEIGCRVIDLDVINITGGEK